MLHLDEVFTAEIYARGGIVVGRCQRGKEVVKPWVSRGVSFGTFLSLMKEKYEHLRKTKKEHHPRGGVLFGACGRIRTGDLLITSELLCQLSHTSMIKAA